MSVILTCYMRSECPKQLTLQATEEGIVDYVNVQQRQAEVTEQQVSESIEMQHIKTRKKTLCVRQRRYKDCRQVRKKSYELNNYRTT